MSDWANVITAVATALTFVVLALTYYVERVRSLKIKIFVDQWIIVCFRCQDRNCGNVHIQLRCLVQALGSTFRSKELYVCKTDLCPPSQRVVEASANNHTEGREFLSSHTPIIIRGGTQVPCIINYKPELSELKEGGYSLKINMRDSKDRHYESQLIQFWLSPQEIAIIQKAGPAGMKIASRPIKKDLS